VGIGCARDNASTQSSDPSENRSQQFPNWPASLNEFRFHWTAEPSVDIATGAAVPIRAYLESYYVASFSANLENVYPGFMRATPENDELDGHYVAQLAWIRPLNGVVAKSKDAVAHFGYIPFHILRIDSAGNGFRAFICQEIMPTTSRATPDLANLCRLPLIRRLRGYKDQMTTPSP